MPRINGWKRQQHYASLDEASDNLDADGSVKIGVWTHGEAGRVEHIYEPAAEKPFLVRTVGTNRSFPEEGRYEYRGEGGSANKDLMRKYP